MGRLSGFKYREVARRLRALGFAGGARLRAVANSSVLITLSMIGRLDLLSRRFPEGILIPQSVWQEVVEKGKRLAYLEGKVEEHSRGFGELRELVIHLDQKVDRFREELAARIEALDQKVRVKARGWIREIRGIRWPAHSADRGRDARNQL